MLPTMAVMGDWVLISKLHRRGRDIKVGDIVAFASVTVPGEKVIKRVVGMEGDYVLRDTPEQDSDKTKVMIQVSCQSFIEFEHHQLTLYSRCQRVTVGSLVIISHGQKILDILDHYL